MARVSFKLFPCDFSHLPVHFIVRDGDNYYDEENEKSKKRRDKNCFVRCEQKNAISFFFEENSPQKTARYAKGRSSRNWR